MAKSSHERQRLFLRQFRENEKQSAERNSTQGTVFREISSRLDYNLVGKDNAMIWEPPTLLLWTL